MGDGRKYRSQTWATVRPFLALALGLQVFSFLFYNLTSTEIVEPSKHTQPPIIPGEMGEVEDSIADSLDTCADKAIADRRKKIIDSAEFDKAMLRCAQNHGHKIGKRHEDSSQDSWDLYESSTTDAPVTEAPKLRKASTESTETEAPAEDKSMKLEPEQQRRIHQIRNAFQFTWKNYKEFAWGADEIKPVNGEKDEPWGRIAMTMLDSVDTLWIMGLKAEYKEARDYIEKKVHFRHLGKDGKSISVFETIIRGVGGLLGAYAVTDDWMFAEKAASLMTVLMPAFDNDDGVFYTYFNPQTQSKSMASWHQNRATLADIGSIQLELRYLTHVTGRRKYSMRGENFYQILYSLGSYKKTGLYPVHYEQKKKKFSEEKTHITFGALGDSFYEYLLKVWIYRRKKEPWLRQMYNDAVQGMINYLVAEDGGFTYLKELSIPQMTGKKRMDHLVCFVPGMLALGSQDQSDPVVAKQHLDLAEKLAETCHAMYERQPTGLAPDVVQFPDFQVLEPKYRLRPETIESFFYLYRATNNTKYQDWGWKIFEATEKHCRTAHGFSGIADVQQENSPLTNKMETYFLAETLKYHFLLQAPDKMIPLDQFVFNTEGHPFEIRHW